VDGVKHGGFFYSMVVTCAGAVAPKVDAMAPMDHHDHENHTDHEDHADHDDDHDSPAPGASDGCLWQLHSCTCMHISAAVSVIHQNCWIPKTKEKE
jgi:hypothetical protein